MTLEALPRKELVFIYEELVTMKWKTPRHQCLTNYTITKLGNPRGDYMITKFGNREFFIIA